ncbi:MAG: tetratricopeptide repeat protein [Pseudomonadota bacterium]
MNKIEGINLCIKGVEEESSAAALYLAELFFQGDLVIKNDTFAFEYYKLANPKRNPLAAFRLGQFYDWGLVVKPDEDKALFWFEMAASQGYSEAYLRCAEIYWNRYQYVTDDRARLLVKTYLWISAAEIVSNDQDNGVLSKDKLEDIDNLHYAVTKEIPTSWQTALDKQVAQHFHKLKDSYLSSDG